MKENASGLSAMKCDMDQYVRISLQLAGFEPVSAEQRAGIRQYYDFAVTMMAPLLNFNIPGEDHV